jgi:hypothetical protein
MMKKIVTGMVAAMLLCIGSIETARAAQGDDPEWPCIQRKVPQLSFGQIWTGKDLPAESSDWRKNQSLIDLVPDLAARRLPLQQAQAEVERFARALPDGERELILGQLINGLFENMDHERSQIISGIARYAKGQNAMAQALRDEASAIDVLRSASDPNHILIDQRQENLIFRMRIFQERAQSLTYVCEVPTLVEQRLYALVQTIAHHMPAP